MAEGIINHFYKDKFIAFSAGSHPQSVHPLAIYVMKEIGIDISNQRSKSVNEFLNEEFDYVIFVCSGDEDGVCPVFQGKAKKTLYWKIPNPTKRGNIEEFRKVRDILKEKIEGIVKNEFD